MMWLKQSTAVTVQIGPFIDDTDGKTAETGLTISQADVRLSKNGANIAQKTESTAASHDELGYYSCDLDTTDTGTLGRLQLMVHESGALPVWHEFMVVPANVYDSLVGGSDALEVDVTALSGDPAAADNAEAFFDGTGYAGTNNVIPTVTTLTGHTAQTGDNYARLGAPAGASIAADLVEIEGQTDDIGAAGAGLTAVPWNSDWDAEVESEVQDVVGAAGASLSAIPWNSAWDAEVESEVDDALGAAGADLTGIPWNAAWDAEVQSEVQDAIEANHLDHLLAATYDPASKPGAADALLNEIVEDDSGVSRFTVNSLENAPSGTGASAATIADAVWEEAIADHSGTSGSTAEALAGATAPSAATVADAVWDEAISGHVAGGSFGEEVQAHAQTGDAMTLADGAITAAKIGADAITSDKIADAAIGADQLASSTLTAVKIGSNAITAAKIADDAIGADQIAASAIGADQIATDALNSDKLATGTISANEIGSNAITAAKIGADAITASELAADAIAEIADAVWEELIADHSGTSGSTAEALDGASAPAASVVADAVWDEATSGHGSAGTFGQEIQAHAQTGDAMTLADNAVTSAKIATDAIGATELAAGAVAEIADAVWDELLADHVTNNTMGKQLGEAALSDELPSSPPSAAAIRTEIDSNSTQLGALVDDAIADSVPADGSLPTIKQALYMITQFLYERSVAGTTVTVKKADGSTSLLTLTLNDGTTPTAITRAS